MKDALVTLHWTLVNIVHVYHSTLSLQWLCFERSSASGKLRRSWASSLGLERRDGGPEDTLIWEWWLSCDCCCVREATFTELAWLSFSGWPLLRIAPWKVIWFIEEIMTNNGLWWWVLHVNFCTSSQVQEGGNRWLCWKNKNKETCCHEYLHSYIFWCVVFVTLDVIYWTHLETIQLCMKNLERYV